MLTGNLLRYTFRNNRFFCRFIDPGNSALQECASELIALYSGGTGHTRAEIGELSAAVVQRSTESKIASGFLKLLEDRTEFAAGEEERDYPALRRELFLRSGALLKESALLDSEEKFREAVRIDTSVDIYGDLPEYTLLSGFKPITPGELLQRYNAGLVQGLLLHAKMLKITVSDPEPAELRKLVKFLKFFRLLAKIERGRNEELKLEISGPFALFDSSRRYGLALAAFFPAVLKLKRYAFSAEITVGKRSGLLELDQSSGLISYYRNLGEYVPEEIRMFHNLFRQKSAGWQIIGETPFLRAGSDGLCFPDLSFRDQTGTVCYLELFHRWHRSMLDARLEFLQTHPETPLILGIDRSAANDEGFAELSEKYPELLPRLFRFRDFPGVDKVLHTLNAFQKQTVKE